LIALGVGKEDYIITTPFTFIATAGVISFLGSKPLFIDIDERTFNIDTRKLEKFLEKTDEKVKGIIAVDLFGQTANYDEIHRITEKYRLFVLEDGAQPLGAEYRGKGACSLEDISTTSFFPPKPLCCFGDGGMVFTNNDKIAEKIKLIRNHGQSERYKHEVIGLNLRLDNLQAAVLLGKFGAFVNQEIDNRIRGC